MTGGGHDYDNCTIGLYNFVELHPLLRPGRPPAKEARNDGLLRRNRGPAA